MNFEKAKYVFDEIYSIINDQDPLDCLPAVSTAIEFLIEKVSPEKREAALRGVLLCITKDNKFKSYSKISEEIERSLIRIKEVSELLGLSKEIVSKEILEQLEKLNLSEDIKVKLTNKIKEDFVDIKH